MGEMGSKWRKIKLALGMKMCLVVPKTLADSPESDTGRFSDAVLLPSSPERSSNGHLDMPTTPVPSSSGLRLPKQSSKSSKQKICAICLNTMKAGHGHAIFTAECCHSFHFHCITSNVKHGNHMCPVCRAKWKEIPFQSPTTDMTRGRSRLNHLSWPQDDPRTNAGRLPPRMDTNRHSSSSPTAAEPNIFNDDEQVDHQPETNENNSSLDEIEVKAYTEVPSISRSDSRSNFTVLINLKAPHKTGSVNLRGDEAGLPLGYQQSRAPVDLVTVLDVSGSMAGTKLALLKRAMGFVIQNLGPSDRLSVIAFSSTARRLFPLRRMSEAGKREALQAVNLLTSSGGTNILQGLKKGAKVMSERKSKNPVSSIILLSDGQDTYSGDHGTNNQSLLPVSMRRGQTAVPHIPVHAFGFGADHDAVAMHSISETSGGTFSFIEAEAVIQDAFAQCIGGLLSVVVQELVLHVECVHPNLRLTSIKSGSYRSRLESNGRIGVIEVGDLYADEERNFLVIMDVPADQTSDETSLAKVKCFYKNPMSKELVTLHAAEAKINRPEKTGPQVVLMEVDRQQNRLQTAEAMAEAKAAADHGDLAAAVSVLDNCRKLLAESVSLKARDRLSVALDAELKEMQDRMSNRQVYETSGRAYVLSGLSSHSWQRATARGDSTESTSLVHGYQTPYMVDMVNLSQTMTIGGRTPDRSLRPGRSFPTRLHPS